MSHKGRCFFRETFFLFEENMDVFYEYNIEETELLKKSVKT